MPRQKKITHMPDLMQAIADYRVAEQEVRAKYEAIIAEEIEERRQNVFDLMFVKYREAGPSEIANSTGLSRTTVIRWRKSFLEQVAGDATLFAEVASAPEPKKAEPERFEFSIEHSTESNEDFHRVDNLANGESVYIIYGDVFGTGATASEADLNAVPRPVWLTDEVMKQAEADTGLLVPGAAWRR